MERDKGRGVTIKGLQDGVLGAVTQMSQVSQERVQERVPGTVLFLHPTSLEFSQHPASSKLAPRCFHTSPNCIYLLIFFLFQ